MKQDHKIINCIPCNAIELPRNLESTAGNKVVEISERCLYCWKSNDSSLETTQLTDYHHL